MIFSLRFSRVCRLAPALLILAVFLSSTQVLAQSRNAQYAHSKRRIAAVGYYAKARALMVEALAQFEQGRKTAQPDLLIDSEEWRLTVITLTEQLNRVIDPQIAIDNSGVTFTASQRMISRERNRVPPVKDGAYDGNRYGEAQWMEEHRARAKMKAAKNAGQAAQVQEEKKEKESEAAPEQDAAAESDEMSAEDRVAAKLIAEQDARVEEVNEGLTAEEDDDIGSAASEATREDIVNQIKEEGADSSLPTDDLLDHSAQPAEEAAAPAKNAINVEEQNMGLDAEPESPVEEEAITDETISDDAGLDESPALAEEDGADAASDDEEVTQAINEAIQERLKSLEATMKEREE